MTIVLRISVFALCLGLPAAVWAQDVATEPSPAQVRVAAEAFDKGREAYKQEDYVEAAEQFEKADDNAPSSAAIELAIRARDLAGELDRAASLAALALKLYPDDADLQKIVPDVLNRASQEMFELSASCDTPCELTVGGKIVHGLPAKERLFFVAPGAVTVRAGWSDRRGASQQIEGTAGGHGQLSFVTPAPVVDVAPPPSAAIPANTAPVAQDSGVAVKSKGWPTTVFWVGAGLTAVAGGVTVWSGLDTVNDPGADRVKRECVGQGESCALYQVGRDKQFRTNVLIGVTAGVGAATLLIGAVATDWGSSSKAAPEASASAQRPLSWRMSPWASAEGGGVAASGRF